MNNPHAVLCAWIVAMVLLNVATTASSMRRGLGFGPVETILRFELLLFIAFVIVLNIALPAKSVTSQVQWMSCSLALIAAFVMIRDGKNQG